MKKIIATVLLIGATSLMAHGCSSHHNHNKHLTGKSCNYMQPKKVVIKSMNHKKYHTQSNSNYCNSNKGYNVHKNNSSHNNKNSNIFVQVAWQGRI